MEISPAELRQVVGFRDASEDQLRSIGNSRTIAGGSWLNVIAQIVFA